MRTTGGEGSGETRREIRVGPERRRVPARQARRRRGVGAFLLRWMLVLGIWATVALAGVVAWFAYGLPDIDNLADSARRPSVTIAAADGAALATYGEVYGEAVRVDELPAFLPAALLATEDRRFYSHFGADPIGIARALLSNWRAGRVVEGASTITQQLAKNLFLTPERSIERKIQEMLLAFWLERRFTKTEILTIYLNRIYFGAGTYGIDAAARRYFGHGAREVSLYEAAVLAGLPKAPSRLNPANDPARAAARAAEVLDNMVEAGYLHPAEAEAAKRNHGQLARVPSGSNSRRWFADWVQDLVGGFVGGAHGDLIVATTLDPRLQAAAEQAVAAALDGEGAKVGVSQAALVALAPDGAVLAMVGGRDYGESQFNRATQALRQPGSAFKPFLYLAALEAGWRPDTRVVDRPVTIKDWSPRNFSGRYQGEMALADALAQSVNTVSVQIVQAVGVDRVIAVAHRLGIASELGRDASLALGTSEVTPLELTASMVPFANGGEGVLPYAIAEIRERGGRVLYRRDASGPRRVIAAGVAGEMNQMLAGVMRRGTGRAAQLGRPAAGKTGTSQEHRDAWFVGWTPDLVAGVWVGNDDGTPTRQVTGGALPARLWKGFMTEALAGVAPRPLPEPPAAVAALPPAAIPAPAGQPGWWPFTMFRESGFRESGAREPGGGRGGPPRPERAGRAAPAFGTDEGKYGN